MATSRISRVYTISLPPDLARKAEALAKLEDRTMSDLFRESFRAYWAAHVHRMFEGLAERQSGSDHNGYTEEDVPRLIAEMRAEDRAAEAASLRTTELVNTH